MGETREEARRGGERPRALSSGERRSGLRSLSALGPAGLLVAVSALLVLHYGQRGFLPLDQSIVFEGGNALRCGRVPFVDLEAPAGLPLFWVQEALSAQLGWSWRTYLVHGALLNVLAALVAFALLTRRYGSLAIPTAAAVATAVVFMPPIGTPYPDHGSFLFSGLAVLLADRARDVEGRARYVRIFAAGAAWGVALLCKPIPALLFLPALPFVAGRLRRPWRRWVEDASTLLLGTAAGLAAPLLGVGTPLHAYIDRGLAPLLVVAGGRLDHLVADSASYLRSVVAPEWLVPLLLWATLFGRSGRRWWRAEGGPAREEGGRALLLSAWFVGAGLAYAGLTFRSSATSLGWFPLAAALAAAPGASRGGNVQTGAATRRRDRALSALLALALLTWLISFHARVNERRSALLLNLHGRSLAAPAGPGLEWLDAATPEFTRTDGDSLRQLLAYLEARPGPVFLLGDSSPIYGLSGRCSPSPVLWFHPHLTVPWKDGRATEEFQVGLIGALERSGVAAVIVENAGTQMGVTPDALPRVRDWVASRTAAERRFGSFQVFELSPLARDGSR